MAPRSNAEYPSTASVLSILGGVFIALASLVVLVIGGVTVSIFLPSDVGSLFIIFAGIGIILGIGIIACGLKLQSAPQSTRSLGAVILLLTIISIPFSFFGFVIGFLLAFVGGILAITWKR